MKKASQVIKKLGELNIGLMDDQPLKILRKDWKASREALVAAMAPERAPKERANAALLLFQTSDESFAEGFCSLLSDKAEDAILLPLLGGIGWCTMRDKSMVDNLRSEPVRRALEETIARSDGDLLNRSLLLLKNIGDPDSRGFLESEFASASSPRRLMIALVLADDADHAAAWEAILAEAEDHPPQDWHFQVRNAIGKHLASQHSNFASQAESFVSRIIEKFLDQPGFVMEQSTALAFLDNAKSAQALPAIRKLQDRYGGRDTVIEGKAIEARARLEAEPSLSELEEKLKDRAVSYHAACALMAQQSGPPADALLDKLIEASRSCYGSDFERFMELIRDCGHPDAHECVRAVLEEKTPGLILRILGKSEGWSADRLGALAAKCGLLASAPTAVQLKAAEELCEEPENLGDLAAAILHLGGCLIEFDLEADEVPPDYAGLIKKFAEISGGQFTPEDLKCEALSGNDGACRITFRTGGKAYKFKTQGLGDWIDEATILQSLNDAVTTSGGTGRYLPFEPHGQHLQVVFGKPEAVEAFSKQTGIALAKNADEDDEEESRDCVDGFWAKLRKKFQ